MPKSQFVDPVELRKPGKIHFTDIDVNQYNATIEEEKKIYTKEDFLRIYRDMAIIREFETMLNLIKTIGSLKGNSTLSALGTIANNYDGMRVGFEMTK